MSAPIDDGGPAFPCGPFGHTMHGEDGQEWHQFDRLPGASLRDFFAAHALVGRLANSYSYYVECSVDQHAAMAVAYADAMLAARKAAP